MATIHLSAILRALDDTVRQTETARFIEDLRTAAKYLAVA
jgi:hypothetical protein